jgi:hypothetical protein
MENESKNSKQDGLITFLVLTVFGLIIALATVWYNDYQTIALKNRQLTRSLNLEADMRNTIHELNHANDSLFEANDSLIRIVKTSIFWRGRPGIDSAVYIDCGNCIQLDTSSFQWSHSKIKPH